MGNFHCIPEKCGRVVYQEYLPPVVRWRYPGEDWQEIEGDDYTIDELPGQCCGTWDLTIFYSVPGCNGLKTYSNTTVRRIPYGTYRRIEYRTDNPFARTLIRIVYYDCFQKIEKYVSVWSSTGKSSVIPHCGDPLARHDMPGSTYQIIDMVRADGSDAGCTKCKFVIYKNQQIVHSDEREECPEVEILPCRLSDEVKEIKIKKEAYLQRIEVRDYGIDYLSIVPPLLKRFSIPSECRNIYNTDIYAPLGLLENTVAPGAFYPFIFVKQICSAPGCPPPEYNVICDCECQSCPDGTCPVECGDHICCYDTSTGKAVKEIEIERYCGDNI